MSCRHCHRCIQFLATRKVTWSQAAAEIDVIFVVQTKEQSPKMFFADGNFLFSRHTIYVIFISKILLLVAIFFSSRSTLPKNVRWEIWTLNLLGAKCQSKMQHCVTILQSGAQTNNRFQCNFSELSDAQSTLWKRILEANVPRFPFIFFNLSGFNILRITSWKTKRSSVDSYGIKHCVKLMHYHTHAMRTYFYR